MLLPTAVTKHGGNDTRIFEDFLLIYPVKDPNTNENQSPVRPSPLLIRVAFRLLAHDCATPIRRATEVHSMLYPQSIRPGNRHVNLLVAWSIHHARCRCAESATPLQKMACSTSPSTVKMSSISLHRIPGRSGSHLLRVSLLDILNIQEIGCPRTV